MRYKVELSSKLTTLHNWAFDESRDTLSALSEKQAQELCYKINEMWVVIDRRKKK